MHLMNCPVCGKRIPFNSPQCPECNFDLTEYLQEPVVKRPPRFRRIIGLIAVVMIALVIAEIAINLWTSAGNTIKLPSVNENNVPAQESVKESAKESEKESAKYTSPVGVYSGNDGNILVLNDNGLAYYYCSFIEFTELECPWEYENNRLVIHLSKMHCDAYADMKDDDFSEILLKADSMNWDPELFKRIQVSPTEYIGRKVEANDPSVTVNPDGTMTLPIDGVTFTIPKQFRNPEKPMEFGDNASAFIEADIDTDYVSTLLFYRDSAPANDSFPASFLSNTKLGSPSEITVANRAATTRSVTGSLNSGFPVLSGIQQVGTLTVINNPTGNTILYVLMIQSKDRAFDNSEVFDEILKTAK